MKVITPQLLLEEKNSIGFIRLLMATLVVIGHGVYYFKAEMIPLTLVPITNNQIALGRFPVDVFFILSGFLISASFEKSKNIYVYFWHRFLRIYPAYLICILVTGIVVSGIWGTDISWNYILQNIIIITKNFNVIPGLFENNPVGSGVNGALWTLRWEVFAYILVGLLGFIGLLNNKKIIIFLFISVWIYFLIIILGQDTIESTRAVGSWQRLLTFFLAGMVIYSFRDSLKLSKKWFLISLMLLFLFILIGNFTLHKGAGLFYIVAPFLLTYVVFYLSVHLPFKKVNSKNDISYGVYIYGTPILQIYSSLNITTNHFFYIVLSVATTYLIAVISWFLIEKNALKYKKIFDKKI